MAIGIIAVLDAIEEVVAGITPDYDPAIGFTLASGNGDLEETALEGDETVRRFFVEPNLDAEEGYWNGKSLEMGRTVDIVVRYVCPPELGGWKRVVRMAASDQDRILHTLTQNFIPDTQTDHTLESILPRRSPRPARLKGSVYVARFAFEVRFALGAQT